MKIKYHNWLQVAIMATMVAFSACSDDPTLYSDTDITGFKVRLGEGNYKQGTIKDGNIIEFKITPDLDLSKLNGITCSFFISPYATVTPTPDVPQDFSKDVHYTVKAQDGTTTDWTVKWTYGGKLNDGEGFEYFFKKWEISVPTPSNKDKDGFGAVFGNYIIDTQFNFYDKYTGQKVDKTLNVTGIDASLCQLVNDDAGNLIGVVKNVGLYRWTTVEGAPQKVANVTPGANKVSATGDIDKVGYVYDSKPDGVGTHAVYKFENGSYTSTLSLVTGRPSNDSNWRQIVAVLGVSDNPPFYVIDAVNAGGVMGPEIGYKANTAGAFNNITGPYIDMWNKKGYAGWGNHVFISGRGIPFNGRWYGSTITCGWGWVGLHLLDPSNNNSLPITETIEPWTTNSCIWTTCSPSDDGESLYLYYGYGVGIRCYELTKYEK
ncbi:DUF5018 domain-containing protein [Bacteroides xylanisolvens]|uniref:DUF5018 domain-containing protein n=1 Tax=Bacteroides xylanisolvens TaxID=371601 RepID=UPI00325BEFD6